MKTVRVIQSKLEHSFVGVVLALAGLTATGQEVPGYPTNIDAYDPREIALLPRFCSHTQLFRDRVPGGNNADEIARWQSVFGSTYQHLHHYCWGLMKTHRGNLLARDLVVRRFYLQSAIDEYNYVLERAPTDFVLLPEILTKKGENLVRVGKGPIAVLDFERAAELKPDYWPPYVQLSDYYKSVGETSKARESLERGLARSPDAPALKRRLDELEHDKAATKRAQ